MADLPTRISNSESQNFRVLITLLFLLCISRDLRGHAAGRGPVGRSHVHRALQSMYSEDGDPLRVHAAGPRHPAACGSLSYHLGHGGGYAVLVLP